MLHSCLANGDNASKPLSGTQLKWRAQCMRPALCTIPVPIWWRNVTRESQNKLEPPPRDASDADRGLATSHDTSRSSM